MHLAVLDLMGALDSLKRLRIVKVFFGTAAKRDEYACALNSARSRHDRVVCEVRGIGAALALQVRDVWRLTCRVASLFDGSAAPSRSCASSMLSFDQLGLCRGPPFYSEEWGALRLTPVSCLLGMDRGCSRSCTSRRT